MPENIKILVCLLTTYERQGWLHPDIGQWLAELPFQNGYSYRVIRAHNFQPAASARNVFCKESKDAEVDWLMMMDNDMAPAGDLFDTVKDAPEDADVVVPVFYVWDGTKRITQLCWGFGDNFTKKLAGPDEHYRLGPGFQPISKFGTGVIFIRPRILKKLPYPYFTYLYNRDGGLESTEDVQFAKLVYESGGKVYGNGSVKVGHYHSVELCGLTSVLDFSVDRRNGNGVESTQGSASPAEPVAVASPAGTR
jgi:hypothetical protein